MAQTHDTRNGNRAADERSLGLERRYAGVSQQLTSFGVFRGVTAPYTSTDWDGDAHSTTAKTKIDLAAKFGVPLGVKAVLAGVNVRDSASAADYCFLALAPNDTPNSGVVAGCESAVNDRYRFSLMVVPCDNTGNIYYQIAASGAGTLDAIIEIWGYWL